MAATDRVCQFYLRGHCNRKKCEFRHSTDEPKHERRRRRPSSVSPASYRTSDAESSKRRDHHREARRSYNGNEPKDFEKEGKRYVDRWPPRRSPSPHRHVAPPWSTSPSQRLPMSETPCRFFLTVGCKFGRLCRFKHIKIRNYRSPSPHRYSRRIGSPFGPRSCRGQSPSARHRKTSDHSSRKRSHSPSCSTCRRSKSVDRQPTKRSVDRRRSRSVSSNGGVKNGSKRSNKARSPGASGAPKYRKPTENDRDSGGGERSRRRHPSSPKSKRQSPPPEKGRRPITTKRKWTRSRSSSSSRSSSRRTSPGRGSSSVLDKNENHRKNAVFTLDDDAEVICSSEDQNEVLTSDNVGNKKEGNNSPQRPRREIVIGPDSSDQAFGGSSIILTIPGESHDLREKLTDRPATSSSTIVANSTPSKRRKVILTAKKDKYNQDLSLLSAGKRRSRMTSLSDASSESLAVVHNDSDEEETGDADSVKTATDVGDLDDKVRGVDGDEKSIGHQHSADLESTKRTVDTSSSAHKIAADEDRNKRSVRYQNEGTNKIEADSDRKAKNGSQCQENKIPDDDDDDDLLVGVGEMDVVMTSDDEANLKETPVVISLPPDPGTRCHHCGQIVPKNSSSAKK